MKNLHQIDKGAEFSPCGKYRYCLWRIWDPEQSAIMFIGLNPSKAGADQDDATIRKVCRIAKNLGYGGVYMVNCFPYISTDPDELYYLRRYEFVNHHGYNDLVITTTAEKVQDVVFAWGNFPVVKDYRLDIWLSEKFPAAMALNINLNGSPKHPLYCPDAAQLVRYKEIV